MVELKLFNRWDVSGIVVGDPGLRAYINVAPVLVPHTQGRYIDKRFGKAKKPIVERLMNKMFGPGHKGKKHWRTSGFNAGKKQLMYNILVKTFEIIEKQTKKNPLQVLVTAIENSSPKEGIATIEYGGVRYPKAMDLSPQRRLDLSLRWITQSANAKSAAAGTKKTIWDTLAEELIAAANNDANNSNAVKKRVELERQAEVSR